MTLQIYSYEFFIKKSIELDRNEYKLSEYSQKQLNIIKKKLNIKKEITKDPIIKPTTLIKQEEVVSTLFKFFNKITEKTYDKLSDEICSIISENISDKEKICKTFFQVVLYNSFFCSLYSKLYKRFINIHGDFVSVLELHTINYVDEIDNIVYISPNEDYDKYCEYVKNVESIKNFTNFLIECFKNDILENETLLKLTIRFQICCLNNINNEDKLLLNDIYVTNIEIIIKDIIKNIKQHENFHLFYSNHKVLMESNGMGKNKKIHFKLLDISEIIEKS